MAAKKSKDDATTIDALMGPSTPEAVPATEIQMEPTEEKDNSRTPRDLEDRAHEEEEMEWQPSRLLPTPKKKDGIDFRYVRVSSGGTVDNMNHSQALRDGWVPVLSDECPELGMIVADVGSAEGNIVFGGMMLCKRDKKIGDKIRAIAARESQSQVDSVDAGYLGDQNASMRKFSDKRTETSFGRK